MYDSEISQGEVPQPEAEGGKLQVPSQGEELQGGGGRGQEEGKVRAVVVVPGQCRPGAEAGATLCDSATLTFSSWCHSATLPPVRSSWTWWSSCRPLDLRRHRRTTPSSMEITPPFFLRFLSRFFLRFLSFLRFRFNVFSNDLL